MPTVFCHGGGVRVSIVPHPLYPASIFGNQYSCGVGGRSTPSPSVRPSVRPEGHALDSGACTAWKALLLLYPLCPLRLHSPCSLFVVHARAPDVLTCHRERMRALHLLCVFAHASVWGNNEHPQDTIPKGKQRAIVSALHTNDVRRFGHIV